MPGAKRKYARYPSCFGKLGCREIADVAEKHGMLVINCFKGDVCCWNSVGLYGTPEQMKAVESEWAENGNELAKRGQRGLRRVSLDTHRSKWATVVNAERRKLALVGDGELFRARGEEELVRAPVGYRELTESELPDDGDICWEYGVRAFLLIDLEQLGSAGKARFKERAFLILRKK